MPCIDEFYYKQPPLEFIDELKSPYYKKKNIGFGRMPIDEKLASLIDHGVIELMDKIPAPGEKVFLKDMEIEVTNASEKHVKEVKVTVRELDEDEERNED